MKKIYILGLVTILGACASSNANRKTASETDANKSEYEREYKYDSLEHAAYDLDQKGKTEARAKLRATDHLISALKDSKSELHVGVRNALSKIQGVAPSKVVYTINPKSFKIHNLCSFSVSTGYCTPDSRRVSIVSFSSIMPGKGDGAFNEKDFKDAGHPGGDRWRSDGWVQNIYMSFALVESGSFGMDLGEIDSESYARIENLNVVYVQDFQDNN